MIKKDFLKKHEKAIRQYEKNFKPYYKEVILDIKNNELLPTWGDKENLINIPGFYADESSTDISVAINENKAYTNADTPQEEKQINSFLDLSKPINIRNFEVIIDYLVNERYFDHKRPFFTRFPFSYDIAPLKIRNILVKLKKENKIPSFPSWPVDKSIETLRYIFIKALEIKTKEKVPYADFWPEKKRCCFIATHDMETKTSFRNIEMIREIEKTYGFKSSWNVLSKRYKLAENEFEKLRQLKNGGCEIGIHGYNHDGKMPYLSHDKMLERLEHSKKTFEEFQCTSFRSPLLQRNEEFLELLGDYFLCDSSMPDTDIKSAFASKSGCCTVFPFMIKNMVEIPITLAQDFRLIYTLKLNEQQMFEKWKDKVDYIYGIGGVINILTHPDDYLTGDEKYLRVYERLLEYMSKKEKIYHDTISNVGIWWKKRSV